MFDGWIDEMFDGFDDVSMVFFQSFSWFIIYNNHQNQPSMPFYEFRGAPIYRSQWIFESASDGRVKRGTIRRNERRERFALYNEEFRRSHGTSGI